jgi:hypothetical protein
MARVLVCRRRAYIADQIPRWGRRKAQCKVICRDSIDSTTDSKINIHRNDTIRVDEIHPCAARLESFLQS